MVNLERASPADPKAVKVSNQCGPVATKVQVTKQFLLFTLHGELHRKKLNEPPIAYMSKIVLTSVLIKCAKNNAKYEYSAETETIVDREQEFFQKMKQDYIKQRKQVLQLEKEQMRDSVLRCRQALERQLENNGRNRYQLLDHPLHRQPHLELQLEDEDSAIAGESAAAVATEPAAPAAAAEKIETELESTISKTTTTNSEQATAAPEPESTGTTTETAAQATAAATTAAKEATESAVQSTLQPASAAAETSSKSSDVLSSAD